VIGPANFRPKTSTSSLMNTFTYPAAPLVETSLLDLLPETSALGPDPRAEIKIILLYDDVAAGRRAMTAAVKLAAGLEFESEPRHSVWRFDLLEDETWHAAATREAVDAEIIIVSTSQPNALPDTVNQWIEDCLAQKTSAGTVLLALFGDENAWMISIHDGVSHFSARQVERPCAVMKVTEPGAFRTDQRLHK
jgi:hypothetical protein